MSLAEIAALLNVDVFTLQRWIKCAYFPEYDWLSPLSGERWDSRTVLLWIRDQVQSATPVLPLFLEGK